MATLHGSRVSVLWAAAPLLGAEHDLRCEQERREECLALQASLPDAGGVTEMLVKLN